MPQTLDTSMHVGLDTHRTGDDQTPYGFVVDWIPWDSGFRGTNLTPGDVITALNDLVFTPDNKNLVVSL